MENQEFGWIENIKPWWQERIFSLFSTPSAMTRAYLRDRLDINPNHEALPLTMDELNQWIVHAIDSGRINQSNCPELWKSHEL